MNKHMKFLIKLIVFIVILVTPIFVMFLIVENTEDQYKNTYLAEFNDKYNLLSHTNDKKIIFVGGSSLPFGLRSDLIEKKFPDYKVVNFGLYATLGTKFMMDMSKVNINEGDIVILSPELNNQTYSLYFNPDAVLQACDGFAFKYKLLSPKDNLSLFYNYFDFAIGKLKYNLNNNAPDPAGIYRHDSFNQYGDIQVERENNIMNNGVDSTMSITTTDELLNNDFIRYVNDYCGYVRRNGAKIYFNFSPCNELAIRSSLNTRNEFQSKLSTKIHCDLLSNLEDCIIDYRYFYDTNFHLNSSGAIYYTALLINNIKHKLGMNDTQLPSDDDNDQAGSGIIVPTPPEKDDDDVIEPDIKDELTDFNTYNGEPNNDYLEYFEYRLVGTSYQIVGIKNEYKTTEKVILPSTYNGKNITTIIANALYGCINLKEVYIGLTYKTFEENCFNGCISLEKIYFFAMDGNTLSPAASGLLNGTSRNIKIYIPEGSNYTTGYTWMKYSEFFVYFTRGEYDEES